MMISSPRSGALGRSAPMLKWRKLKLKAKLESNLSCFTFKRLVPGAFSLGLIGSICTALPCAASAVTCARRWAAATRPWPGLTLVHFSAQLEPCLTQENALHTLNTP
jgi:hypothetical protein